MRDGKRARSASLQKPACRYGREVLKRRLKILWHETCGPVWFAGIVKDFSIEERHLIKYDDGDTKWHDLTAEEDSEQLVWEMAHACPQHRSDARPRARAAMSALKRAPAKRVNVQNARPAKAIATVAAGPRSPQHQQSPAIVSEASADIGARNAAIQAVLVAANPCGRQLSASRIRLLQDVMPSSAETDDPIAAASRLGALASTMRQLGLCLPRDVIRLLCERAMDLRFTELQRNAYLAAVRAACGWTAEANAAVKLLVNQHVCPDSLLPSAWSSQSPAALQPMVSMAGPDSDARKALAAMRNALQQSSRQSA
jgi:hypothetical protein